MSLLKKNLILIVLIVIICVFPLIVLKDAEFLGADGKAEEAITQIAPDYKPWSSPIFQPPSGEVESLLFSLQAAIGSGVVFFILGRMTAKSERKEDAGNR